MKFKCQVVTLAYLTRHLNNLNANIIFLLGSLQDVGIKEKVKKDKNKYLFYLLFTDSYSKGSPNNLYNNLLILVLHVKLKS
jgi:hypothetical protein